MYFTGFSLEELCYLFRYFAGLYRDGVDFSRSGHKICCDGLFAGYMWALSEDKRILLETLFDSVPVVDIFSEGEPYVIQSPGLHLSGILSMLVYHMSMRGGKERRVYRRLISKYFPKYRLDIFRDLLGVSARVACTGYAGYGKLSGYAMNCSACLGAVLKVVFESEVNLGFLTMRGDEVGVLLSCGGSVCPYYECYGLEDGHRDFADKSSIYEVGLDDRWAFLGYLFFMGCDFSLQDGVVYRCELSGEYGLFLRNHCLP